MHILRTFIVIICSCWTCMSYSQVEQRLVEALDRTRFGVSGEIFGSKPDLTLIDDAAAAILAPPWITLKSLTQPQQKRLLQSKIQSSSDRALLKVVVSVLNGVADGQLDPDLGEMALVTTSHYGFVPMNYRNKGLADVLARLSSRYADRPRVVADIKDVLSGASRTKCLKYWADNELTPIKEVEDAEKTQSGPSLTTASSSIYPNQTQTTKDATTSATATNESGKLMPWALVFVMIAAASGLLWLVLKRRAK